MLLYPTTPIPQYPFDYSISYNTLVNNPGSKSESISLWDDGLREYTLNYNVINKADKNILWAFFNAHKGKGVKFHFYGNEESFVDQRIEDGDGLTVAFDLSAREVVESTLVVTVNQFVETAYSFSEGSGTNGSDEIIFDTAPAEADLILISYTGEKRFTCRFSDDKISMSEFAYKLTKTGLNISEVVA